jgi:hypothetical protein
MANLHNILGVSKVQSAAMLMNGDKEKKCVCHQSGLKRVVTFDLTSIIHF